MNIKRPIKPAYLVIAESIRQQVRNEQLKPGDRLPTERELVDEFGVARMTVRHALDTLQLEGLIERRRGRAGGTFVYAEKAVIESISVDGLQSRIVVEDSTIETKILGLQKLSATQEIAEKLEMRAGAEVWELKRLKFRDGEPVMLGIYFFPADIYPTLCEESVAIPLGEMMKDRFDITPAHLVESVEPYLANEQESELLGLRDDQAALQITRQTKGRDGTIIEASRGIIHPDRGRLELVAGRDPAPR